VTRCRNFFWRSVSTRRMPRLTDGEFTYGEFTMTDVVTNVR
jgi:hypothetical protein